MSILSLSRISFDMTNFVKIPYYSFTHPNSCIPKCCGYLSDSIQQDCLIFVFQNLGKLGFKCGIQQWSLAAQEHLYI